MKSEHVVLCLHWELNVLTASHFEFCEYNIRLLTKTVQLAALPVVWWERSELNQCCQLVKSANLELELWDWVNGIRWKCGVGYRVLSVVWNYANLLSVIETCLPKQFDSKLDRFKRCSYGDIEETIFVIRQLILMPYINCISYISKIGCIYFFFTKITPYFV